MWHVKRDMWHVTCDTWHVTRDMWHVTRDTWHVTQDTWHMTHRRALSGGVERGTNERPGIWSCDLWANERPGKKIAWGGDKQTNRQTDGHCDSMTELARYFFVMHNLVFSLPCILVTLLLVSPSSRNTIAKFSSQTVSQDLSSAPPPDKQASYSLAVTHRRSLNCK